MTAFNLRVSCLILALAACQREAATPAEAPTTTTSSPLLYEYPSESLARRPLTMATAELRPLRSYCEAPARVGYDEQATAHVAAALSGRIVALQKGVGEVVIEARLNDEDADGVAYDWSSPSMSRQPTMRRP